MATLTRCCCWFKRQQSVVLSDESKPERRPKSVNILLGCFFLINYTLGNGFLTYPYSFYYAGYLAAIPTLLLITFMCTIAAIWEVEVMARAQVGSTEVGLCMWPLFVFLFLFLSSDLGLKSLQQLQYHFRIPQHLANIVYRQDSTSKTLVIPLYVVLCPFICYCIKEEKVICYQLELGNNLPTFPLNAPVIVRVKVVQNWCTITQSPWWQLDHSVETSASYFLSSSWYS